MRLEVIEIRRALTARGEGVSRASTTESGVACLNAAGDRSLSFERSHPRSGRPLEPTLDFFPSSRKIAVDWGRLRSFPQGPRRGFPIREAASAKHDLKLLAKIPSPLQGSDETWPRDVKDAAAPLSPQTLYGDLLVSEVANCSSEGGLRQSCSRSSTMLGGEAERGAVGSEGTT